MPHALSSADLSEYTTKYPYIFHFEQKDLWEQTLATKSTYYPPTYLQSG